MIPILLITGPVGVGKSTVALEISEILNKKDISHAMIDIDYLRYAFPRPKDDPYAIEVGYKNLADVVKNFLDFGVTRLIIPTILEEKEDIERIKQIIPNASVIVVRLRGALSTIENNLKQREIGMGLDWHLQRAKELHEHYEITEIEDIVIDIDNKSINHLANEIIEKSHLLEI